MRDSLLTRLLLLFAASVSLYTGSLVTSKTNRLRDTYQLSTRPSREGVPPEYVLTSALLGGFRGLFITTLWIRAQNMKNDGKFYEMVDIYNIITKLQPNHHMAWAFQSWDLTYNVSVEFNETQDRVFWVFRGIDLLRKQGIPRAPHIPELYQELAWMFHHKIGADLDYAHPVYRLHLARQMARIMRGMRPEDISLLGEIAALRKQYPTKEIFLNRSDPRWQEGITRLKAAGVDPFVDFEVILGPKVPEKWKAFVEESAAREVLRQAGMWTVGKDLKTEVGMDVEEMYRLSAKFGPIDWRTAYAHSLYWATLGYNAWYRSRDRKMTLKYERLVYFSLISLVNRGKPLFAPDGQVHYVPDSRLFEAVVKHMDEMIEFFRNTPKKDGKPIPLTGAISGYGYFLMDAIYTAYFEGKPALAGRLLKKYEEVKDIKQPPLKQWVVENFSHYIDDPSISEVVTFVQPRLQRGYLSLAMGDFKGYTRSRSEVDFFYKGFALNKWNPDERERAKDPDYRGHLPPLKTLRTNVVMQLLRSSYPYYLKQRLMQQLSQHEPAVAAGVKAELEKIENRRKDSEILKTK